MSMVKHFSNISILQSENNLSKLEVCETVLHCIDDDLNQRNVSIIWIINDKNFEYIEINYNNNIQINIGKLNGRNLLIKIICFSSKKNKPIYLIVKKDNINIRKILYRSMKIQNQEKIFNHLMTCFIILTENLYKSYILNNTLPVNVF